MEHSWQDKLIAWIYAFHPYLLKHGLYQVAEPYLSTALNFLAEGELEKRYLLLAAREKVLEILGKRDVQRADLDTLQRLAETLNQDCLRSEVALRCSIYSEGVSDFPASAAAAGGLERNRPGRADVWCLFTQAGPVCGVALPETETLPQGGAI